MERTKSNKISSKIIQAESLRLRALRQDPEFQADLKALEDMAKRLPTAPLIPVTQLNKNNWRLPANSEKAFAQWSDVAQSFLDHWGFKPCLTEDNTVKLLIRSPVSVKLKRSTRSATWIISEERFAPGDVKALQVHYARILKKNRTIVERRVNLKTMEKKAIALELKAKGKDLRAIAKALDPKIYRQLTGKATHIKNLPPGDLRERFNILVMKYAQTGVGWASAEKKAAIELGLQSKSRAAAAKPLTERVRHLLKKAKDKSRT